MLMASTAPTGQLDHRVSKDQPGKLALMVRRDHKELSASLALLVKPVLKESKDQLDQSDLKGFPV